MARRLEVEVASQGETLGQVRARPQSTAPGPPPGWRSPLPVGNGRGLRGTDAVTARNPPGSRTGVYAVGMASEQSQSDTPVLDQWRGEVGDEAIRTVVDVARERIADGSLPGFSDPRAFLQYLREPRRRSA